jgi:hypothetical protein
VPPIQVLDRVEECRRRPLEPGSESIARKGRVTYENHAATDPEAAPVAGKREVELDVLSEVRRAGSGHVAPGEVQELEEAPVSSSSPHLMVAGAPPRSEVER